MNVTAVDFSSRGHHHTQTRASAFTIAQADEVWRTKFAPWVQDLGLVVEESTSTGARLRMPFSPRLSRVGDTICGQSLMAAGDSAMAFAICAVFGEFRNITTVGQTISFMRAIGQEDVVIDATVTKTGRSLIFGEVTFRASGSSAIAAHATATWALIP